MGTVKHPKLCRPTLLTPDHQLAGFSCAQPSLTLWLRKRALANQAVGASRSYVVTGADQAVLGYYSLAPGAVELKLAPGAIRRNMPAPVPVFVLGKLAVDERWCGAGIGSGLLKDALLRCMHAADIIGGRAVLCHAIDDVAKAFYLKHGFVPSPVEPHTLMLSLKMRHAPAL